MVDNRELKVQLHQLVLGVATGVVSFGTIVGMSALWVNAQLAVLSERVATQTASIQKLSESNVELYRMWADHEARLQVITAKLERIQ